MEAIKLPAPLSVVPTYDPEQLTLQLGRARYDNDGLRYKNTCLEAENRALRLEVERLQIEADRHRELISRLEQMADAASYLKEKNYLNLSGIVALVCAYKGLTEERLKSRRRHQDLVYARNLCFYLCYDFGKEGTVAMGRYFDRDHTTAVYGRKYVLDKLPYYDDVKADVDYLTAQIKTILNN